MIRPVGKGEIIRRGSGDYCFYFSEPEPWAFCSNQLNFVCVNVCVIDHPNSPCFNLKHLKGLKAKNRISINEYAVILLIKMVGAEGFEPSTFCTPSKRATSLRYAPMVYKADATVSRSPSRVNHSEYPGRDS